MSKELLEFFNHKREKSDYPLHNFHAYPCKFPAFIPREIIKYYAKKGDVICDPFAGSGTTLLEATLLNHSSIGNDINPLSCLLSKVKAKPINEKLLNSIDKFLYNFLDNYDKSTNITIFYYKSIDHWFQKNVIKELSFIRGEILKIKNEDLKDLLLIVLSSIIVKVSNQESDTRYAAINKNIKDLETIKLFIKKAREVKDMYLDFFQRTKNFKLIINVLHSDSRNLSNISNDSVDIIITSPPYANTYDYYLYHKHRKYWLGMDIKFAQMNEIGSRREFSSLKESPNKWEEDIEKCLLEMKRIIKNGGSIFIIIGDSVINKKLIKMNKMVKNLSERVGLKHVECVSMPLAKHSRMFNPSFASIFKKEEHLILLKKYYD